MTDLEELKQTVEENREGNQTVGQTNVRLDATCVTDVKQELGVNQNTELAPFVEAVLYDAIGEEDKAEERTEAFKAQFTDE